MGILDSIVSGLAGNAGEGGGMGGVLMNMLGGNRQAAGQPGYSAGMTPGMAPGMGQGLGMGGMPGGLGSLLAMFEQAGLGQVVQSWISNGPNQPVSPQQLQSAFGDDQVQSMANQAGMAPQDFLSQLAQHLPTAVDSLTPHGRLPEDGTLSV